MPWTFAKLFMMFWDFKHHEQFRIPKLEPSHLLSSLILPLSFEESVCVFTWQLLFFEIYFPLPKLILCSWVCHIPSKFYQFRQRESSGNVDLIYFFTSRLRWKGIFSGWIWGYLVTCFSFTTCTMFITSQLHKANKTRKNTRVSVPNLGRIPWVFSHAV